jgi:ABC-type transport system involved in multi-copper enzyme maturation permease subunit
VEGDDVFRVVSIARNTFKEVVREPVYYILVSVACLMIVVTRFMPLFTLSEDIKMMRDIGLSTVNVTVLLVSLLAASRVVYGEIESRTAFTVVAKPVRRSQFILGKYFGILAAAFVAIVVVGLVFAAMLWWQVLDQPLPEAQQLQRQMQGVLAVAQGCLLSMFQVMVLAAVSVAASIYATMVVNVGVCFSLFLLGNLTGWFLVHALPSAQGAPVGHVVIGSLLGLFPLLETYNAQALSLGTRIPVAVLVTAFAYAVYYSAAALVIAIALFHRREL